MGKKLTQQLILAKSKTDNLFNLKNLNLWGNELEDLSILRQMPNLEVLSLSVNNIKSLQEFANCLKLQELYLRKNEISDLNEIIYLTGLQNLKVLWLWDNPCMETPNYRKIIIKTLPTLVKLDNTNVTLQGKDMNCFTQTTLDNYLKSVYQLLKKCFILIDILEKEEAQNFNIEQNLGQQNVNPQVQYIEEQINYQKQPQKFYQDDYYPQYNKVENPFAQEDQQQFLVRKDSQQQQYQQQYIQPQKQYQYEQNDQQKMSPEYRNQNNNPFEKTTKSENILCAVLSLIKELDDTSLFILKKQVDLQLGYDQDN